MLGIYIHIPFCERKCSYCAFSSFVSSKDEQTRYVNALKEEIATFCAQHSKEKYRKVDTIFIGGGTPSILEKEMFAEIINSLKENFEFSQNLEFTVECNPNSLNEEKLDLYKKYGVNRISIGVQSLDDEELKFIGRLHDRIGAIGAVKKSLEKFDNVSADLLIGIKGMKGQNYLKNLEVLTSLGIKHISTYMLQVEKDTPLFDLVEEDRGILPSDEECIDVYNKTVDFLKQKGFCQYEVSNFAQKGYECKHNIKYWTGEEYIGFGLSAHSYLNGKRFANAKTFGEYYSKKIAMQEHLTAGQLIEEHIMLGLRCNKGVDKSYLLSFGYDICKNEYLADFVEKAVIIDTKERLFLNPEFYGVNNYIIVHLLP